MQNKTHQTTAVDMLKACVALLEETNDTEAATKLLNGLTKVLSEHRARITIRMADDIVDEVDWAVTDSPSSESMKSLRYEASMLLCDEDNRVDEHGADGWSIFDADVKDLANSYTVWQDRPGAI